MLSCVVSTMFTINRILLLILLPFKRRKKNVAVEMPRLNSMVSAGIETKRDLTQSHNQKRRKRSTLMKQTIGFRSQIVLT